MSAATLTEVQGADPAVRTARVTPAPSQEALIEEHGRRVASAKKKIKDELESAGHTTDDEVRTVNGTYVGLFVLPSPNHLYVGYGTMGGQQGYRGEESGFQAKEIATALVEYVSRNK